MKSRFIIDRTDFHGKSLLSNQVTSWFPNPTQIFKFNPSRPDSERREKINSNFYFHTSLWCLKRFHKTFWGTTKKCETKLIFISIQVPARGGTG